VLDGYRGVFMGVLMNLRVFGVLVFGVVLIDCNLVFMSLFEIFVNVHETRGVLLLVIFFLRTLGFFEFAIKLINNRCI
jgi:hypothetical protein